MTWTIENQAGVLHPQGSGVESSDAIPVNPQDQEEKVNIDPAAKEDRAHPDYFPDRH